MDIFCRDESDEYTGSITNFQPLTNKVHSLWEYYKQIGATGRDWVDVNFESGAHISIRYGDDCAINGLSGMERFYNYKRIVTDVSYYDGGTSRTKTIRNMSLHYGQKGNTREISDNETVISRLKEPATTRILDYDKWGQWDQNDYTWYITYDEKI